MASTVLFFSCVIGATALNDRPIIGILTQPPGAEFELLTDNYGGSSNQSYIAASYVKFAEQGGARVVPLHFDASDAELTTLFAQINGIILPGGGAEIRKIPGNRFREAAELLYDLAVKANDKNDSFPIHGTCLGFQMLSAIAAKDDAVICAGCYDTEGTPLPLELTPAAKTSKLLAAMPGTLLSAVTTENITENSHTSGIDPEVFARTAKLNEFFQVLSTNSDSRGTRFVSTIEARRYPISASQWHPEKSNFEWGKIGKLGFAAIPHTPEAMALSQYIANNFVQRARQSSHHFTSPEAEKAALIYNTAAISPPWGYFDQVYLWGKAVQKSLPVIV